MLKFETMGLSKKPNYIAPDGSEIRLLPGMKGGGLAHCTLPIGSVSLAVTHKIVEEIWYFLSGHGKVWRKQETREKVVKVEPGICLTIPVGTHFQFRNTCQKPLCFIIATIPPWPGEEEAARVEDYWEDERNKS
jgi:mannose-6-phosphate isomerase-like protein (cupin superfamily)